MYAEAVSKLYAAISLVVPAESSGPDVANFDRLVVGISSLFSVRGEPLPHAIAEQGRGDQDAQGTGRSRQECGPRPHGSQPCTECHAGIRFSEFRVAVRLS